MLAAHFVSNIATTLMCINSFVVAAGPAIAMTLRDRRCLQFKCQNSMTTEIQMELECRKSAEVPFQLMCNRHTINSSSMRIASLRLHLTQAPAGPSKRGKLHQNLHQTYEIRHQYTVVKLIGEKYRASLK